MSAEDESSRRPSDVAYQRILEGLFQRRLPVGAFVSQSDLVELVGLPLGAIRDALRVLEAEGVLTIHPRSGIEFVKPGLELTKSTYQYRTILERAAVRVFSETAAQETLTELASRHEAAIEIIERTNVVSAATVDEIETLEKLLHNAVIGSLNNVLIENSYRRIHNYLNMVRLDRLLTPPLALRTLREHKAIIDACLARNADSAEAALQTHFTASLQRYMGLY
jgi:DNA-binding GntR family transcriptional regulator